MEFASLTPRHQILDICCGTGDLTSWLAKQDSTGQVVGIDISRSALEIARAKIRHIPITLLRANGNDLPFDSARFDKCFICFGLHHMTGQGRQKTLTEIHRVLAPEGALYIIDYNLPERGLRKLAAIAYARLDSSDEAYQMLKDGSLSKVIKEAGFEIQRRGLACQDMVQLLEVVKN